MILNNQTCEGFRNSPKPYALFSFSADTFIEKCFNEPNPSQSEFSSTKGQQYLNTRFSLI